MRRYVNLSDSSFIHSFIHSLIHLLITHNVQHMKHIYSEHNDVRAIFCDKRLLLFVSSLQWTRVDFIVLHVYTDSKMTLNTAYHVCTCTFSVERLLSTLYTSHISHIAAGIIRISISNAILTSA